MLNPETSAVTNGPAAENTQLLEWIDPEVRQLAIRETAFRDGGGGDGETHYADCSKS